MHLPGGGPVAGSWRASRGPAAACGATRPYWRHGRIHAVLVVGYKDEELRIVSWGEEMTMTMDFWEAYSVESYAVFSEAFIQNDKTPTGVDINVLRNDIETLQKKKAGI